MKASIITLHTVNSFGSVLQTYATQKVFQKLGLEVEFVDYWRECNSEKYYLDKFLEGPKMLTYQKYWDHFLLRDLTRLPLRFMMKRTRRPMRKFINKYINLSPRSYNSSDELDENPPLADIYVTGSDQVWNSIHNQGIEYPYFLTFAPQNKLRIAYASSIGRETLDKEEKKEMVNLLERFQYISVREQSAVNLLKEMGVKSKLVLDPTLMLTKEEWLEIASSKLDDKPYLLIFQLNKNKMMDDYAIKLARNNEWNIVRISPSITAKLKGKEHIVWPDVGALLSYFNNSACILTDSFHATAFAINFSRNFLVVLPPRFSTRLTSILDLFGLESRIITDFQDFDKVNRDIDYAAIQKDLQRKREENLGYLHQVLS